MLQQQQQQGRSGAEEEVPPPPPPLPPSSFPTASSSSWSEGVSPLPPCHCSCSSDSTQVGLRDARTHGRTAGGCVVMTGCGPQLGVLLLLAVLLQTVVVTITVLHFTAALNTVSL